jgi:hypothetical protein
MSMATRQLPCAILAIAITACGGCGSNPPPPAPMPPPPQMAMPPPPPQPGPCDQVQTLATTTAMQARAAAEAPGMKPEPISVCGVVSEGQTVTSQMFVLEPGYCYTFLGQSLPPVSSMEMVLAFDGSGAGAFLPQGFQNLANMAQGNVLTTTTPGERVNMGEKQNCYTWNFPMPGTVKLVLKAHGAPGPVAATVYKKKKL